VYRARLLAAVARRLPKFGDIERIVALAGLDLAAQPGALPAPPKTNPDND
jgi:hypothetical protein